ncbi:Uncharacterised protein [Vibrio cholerae]|nr:Uncharacterised protein [Vibrio cholerae]
MNKLLVAQIDVHYDVRLVSHWPPLGIDFRKNINHLKCAQCCFSTL